MSSHELRSKDGLTGISSRRSRPPRHASPARRGWRQGLAAAVPLPLASSLLKAVSPVSARGFWDRVTELADGPPRDGGPPNASFCRGTDLDKGVQGRTHNERVEQVVAEAMDAHRHMEGTT